MQSLEFKTSMIEGMRPDRVSAEASSCRPHPVGKSVRQPRYSKSQMNNVILATLPKELPYADVVLPVETAPPNHCKYFVTLRDEYTGYFMDKFVVFINQTATAAKSSATDLDSLSKNSVRSLSEFSGREIRGSGEMYGGSTEVSKLSSG